MIMKTENDYLFNSLNHCRKECAIKKFNYSLYKKINDYNIKFSNITWACKVYNYLHNIVEFPKCPECGNILEFHKIHSGYRKYCSIKCSANSIEIKNKRDSTIMQLYGVDNISQNSMIKNKKKETSNKHYGVDSYLLTIEGKNKMKEILIKKFGVDNISKNESIKQKKILTFKQNENKNNLKLKIKYSKLLNIAADDIEYHSNVFTIKNCCKNHSEFKIKYNNLYERLVRCKFENICTICNPIGGSTSIKEIEIRDFLNHELNIETKKMKIENSEIDIFSPKHNIGIEHDGLFWHSEIQKRIHSSYHLNKTNLCENRNIQLLHFYEDE